MRLSSTVSWMPTALQVARADADERVRRVPAGCSPGSTVNPSLRRAPRQSTSSVGKNTGLADCAPDAKPKSMASSRSPEPVVSGVLLVAPAAGQIVDTRDRCVDDRTGLDRGADDVEPAAQEGLDEGLQPVDIDQPGPDRPSVHLVRKAHDATLPPTGSDGKGPMARVPHRGAALGPRVHPRGRAVSRNPRLEHPLQLPSPPRRRRKPTASITTPHPRHRTSSPHTARRRGPSIGGELERRWVLELIGSTQSSSQRELRRPTRGTSWRLGATSSPRSARRSSGH